MKACFNITKWYVSLFCVFFNSVKAKERLKYLLTLEENNFHRPAAFKSAVLKARAVLHLYLGRGQECLLWCVLQQDIIAYRLCNPFIVEFIYFFGHVERGTKYEC